MLSGSLSYRLQTRASYFAASSFCDHVAVFSEPCAPSAPHVAEPTCGALCFSLRHQKGTVNKWASIFD